MILENANIKFGKCKCLTDKVVFLFTRCLYISDLGAADAECVMNVFDLRVTKDQNWVVTCWWAGTAVVLGRN